MALRRPVSACHHYWHSGWVSQQCLLMQAQRGALCPQRSHYSRRVHIGSALAVLMMRSERPGAGKQLCLARPCAGMQLCLSLPCLSLRGHAFQVCAQLGSSAQHCSSCSLLNSFLDEQALHVMLAQHVYGRAWDSLAAAAALLSLMGGAADRLRPFRPHCE